MSWVFLGSLHAKMVEFLHSKYGGFLMGKSTMDLLSRFHGGKSTGHGESLRMILYIFGGFKQIEMKVEKWAELFLSFPTT